MDDDLRDIEFDHDNIIELFQSATALPCFHAQQPLFSQDPLFNDRSLPPMRIFPSTQDLLPCSPPSVPPPLPCFIARLSDKLSPPRKEKKFPWFLSSLPFPSPSLIVRPPPSFFFSHRIVHVALVESPKAITTTATPKKRKPKQKKSKNPNKRIKRAPTAMATIAKPNNPSKKMIKLFHKRVREYNSNDDDDDDEEQSIAELRDLGAEALQDQEDAISSGDSGEEEEGQRGLDPGDDFIGDSEGDDEDEGDGAR